MVQNAAEGKEDVGSVSAKLGCSHTGLLIVGNSNKLLYLTSRITALSSTKVLHNYHSSLRDKTHALIQEHPNFCYKLLYRIKLHCCSLIQQFCMVTMYSEKQKIRMYFTLG